MTKERIEVLFPIIARRSSVLLVIGASLFLLAYVGVAMERLSYPFEIDWVEGGYVAQVQQILDGKPVYDRPSADYIAAIYSPLYFYVSALISLAFGSGFFSPRLVSFLASLGCFVFIFLIVHRRTRSSFASFMASCLYAATFSIAGSMFDLVHPDSLFLLFVLAGIYTFDSSSVPVRSLVSPLFLILAFLTKQPGLAIAAGLSLAAMLTRRKSERFVFPIVFVALFLLSYVLMNGFTAEWYRYYVFELPSQHAIVRRQLIFFWTVDLAILGIALCFCYLAFVSTFVENATVQTIGRDIMIFGSLVLASCLMRLHAGSWVNNLIPAFAGIAIYFGIGLGLSLRRVGRIPALRFLLVVAAALQFLQLSYWPPKAIPSSSNREEAEKLLQRVASIRGNVFMSAHPWILKTLGKPIQAHEMAADDIMRAYGSDEIKQLLEKEMEHDVTEGRYEAFMVDFKEFPLRVHDFAKYYELVDSNMIGYIYPQTSGWWGRKPTYLYMRRPVQDGASVYADSSGR